MEPGKLFSVRGLVFPVALCGIALVACQEQLSPTSSVGDLTGAAKVNAHSAAAVSCPMTYLINNPPTDLVNTGGSCGLSWNNACGGGPYGFTWTDSLPSDYTVTSVTVEMSSGTDCHGSSLTTTLNGADSGAFAASFNCLCGARSSELIYTIDAPPASYIKGGVNTFLVTNLSSCFGFFAYPTGINALARITVGCTAPPPPPPTPTPTPTPRVERPSRPARPRR